MALTHVFLKYGKSPAYKEALLDNIYAAMRETFGVPEGDRFMLLSEHERGDFSYARNYLGIKRSDELIVVQITCNNTRTTEQKMALYKRIVERLSKEPGVRPEDVFISLVEVPKENWSFGYGVAQYVSGLQDLVALSQGSVGKT